MDKPDTPAELKAIGNKWLSLGSHTLVVVPGARKPIVEEPSIAPAPTTLPPVDPRYTTTPSPVDRSFALRKQVGRTQQTRHLSILLHVAHPPDRGRARSAADEFRRA